MKQMTTKNGYRITQHEAGFCVQEPTAASPTGWAFTAFVSFSDAFGGALTIKDVVAVYEAQVTA